MENIDVPNTARRWDCLSLGEVMLRLDPGEGRIHTSRHFQVWEGGGEYNVARAARTPISYDLNFRDSLWKSIGGKVKAQEVNRELVRKVDLLLGNEEDFSAMLGVQIKGVSEDFAELPIAAYEEMLREVAAG